MIKLNVSDFIFTGLYALFITTITWALEREKLLVPLTNVTAISLEMENAIYDFFQFCNTIDDDKKGLLDNLAFINLDSAFVSTESDRIQRDRLAALLNQLAKIKGIKAIYLDHLFVPVLTNSIQYHKDSLLAASLKHWEDKLVLPYQIKFDPNYNCLNFGKIPSNAIKTTSALIDSTNHIGYASPMPSRLEECYRYHNWHIGKYHSNVYALMKILYADNTDAYFQDWQIPHNFEINYVLSHNNQYIQALQASKIQKLAGRNDPQLSHNLKDKIIFIGLFDIINSKYERSLNEFQTAIHKGTAGMPGIYISINTYLNLVNKIYIRRAGMALVFGFNIFLVLGAIFYKKFQQKGKEKNWYWILFELITSVILFCVFFYALFNYYYIKFPFVITILSFICISKIHAWYTYFKEQEQA